MKIFQFCEKSREKNYEESWSRSREPVGELEDFFSVCSEEGQLIRFVLLIWIYLFLHKRSLSSKHLRLLRLRRLIERILDLWARGKRRGQRKLCFTSNRRFAFAPMTQPTTEDFFSQILLWDDFGKIIKKLN